MKNRILLLFLFVVNLSFSQVFIDGSRGGGVSPSGSFSGYYGDYLQGGTKVVYNITARNNIPTYYRDTTTLVVITKADSSIWILQGGTSNTNWVKKGNVGITISGSGTDSYLPIYYPNGTTLANSHFHEGYGFIFGDTNLIFNYPIYSDVSTMSIDTKTRRWYDADGNYVADWNSGYLYDKTNTNTTTVKWFTRELDGDWSVVGNISATNFYGNATTSNKWLNPININGVAVDGSSDVTISTGGSGNVTTDGSGTNTFFPVFTNSVTIVNSQYNWIDANSTTHLGSESAFLDGLTVHNGGAGNVTIGGAGISNLSFITSSKDLAIGGSYSTPAIVVGNGNFITANYVSVGSTTNGGAKFNVTGIGNTSSSHTFNLYNNSGTNYFYGRDDGKINYTDGTQVDGYSLVYSSAGYLTYKNISGVGGTTLNAGNGISVTGTSTSYTAAIATTYAGQTSISILGIINNTNGFSTTDVNGSGLSLQPSIHSSFIGDYGLLGNGNYIQVNDASNLIGINANNISLLGNYITTGTTTTITAALFNGTARNAQTWTTPININGIPVNGSANVTITANQTITLSGDVSGSGTTAITTAIGSGKVTNTMLVSPTFTVNGVGGTLGNSITIPTGNTYYAGTGLSLNAANTFSITSGAITNTMLANSTVSGIALGSNLNNLSISAELISGGASTYNGGAAKSIGIQSASVTNAMLANSSITLNGTSMTLGSTYTVSPILPTFTITTTTTLTPNAAQGLLSQQITITVSALASAVQIATPTGTNGDFQNMIIRIKDNGTARAITYSANYGILGTTLPTTTVAGKWLIMGFIYNYYTSTWQCVATQQEAGMNWLVLLIILPMIFKRRSKRIVFFLSFFVLSFLVQSATRYEVGIGTNWNSTTSWSTTSGGSSGASVPTTTDDVILDSHSGNSTITANIIVNSINCTGFTGTLTQNASVNLQIGNDAGTTGNLTFVSVMTYVLGSATTSKIYYASGGTITTGGKTLGLLNISNGGGVYFGAATLGDNLTCNSLNIASTGGLNCNGHNVTSLDLRLNDDGTYGSKLSMAGITWTITGNWNNSSCWYNYGSGYGNSSVTTNSVTAIKFTDATAYDKYFYDYDNYASYAGTIWFTGTGTGTYKFTSPYGSSATSIIKDDNTSAHTIQFLSGATYNCGGGFNVNGSAGNVISLIASTSGSYFSLSKSSGTVNCTYLSIKDSHAGGGATWNATNSTNVSGNSGWNITSPASNSGAFFLLLH